MNKKYFSALKIEHQSIRGILYLPTFVICLLTIIISPQVTMGQIMYNKAKPYSYQSEELLTVNQLPTLEYNVSSEGNLFIDNLNVNVKEKALIERKGDKYIITDDIEISNIFNDDILHSSVICNSDCSELNIGIFSIHGELLISKDFRIKKGVNEFNINTVKLTQGVYIYSIEISDRMITSDKFIVY